MNVFKYVSTATACILIFVALIILSIGAGYWAGFQAGREPQRQAERVQKEKVAVSVIIEALEAYQRSLTNSAGQIDDNSP